MNGIVSIMTFLPLLGMLAILFVPSRQERLIKQIALLVTLLTLVVSVEAYREFNNLPLDAQHIDYQPSAPTAETSPADYLFQPPLGERHKWIPQLGIYYEVGVDGLSLPLILLTTLLMVLVVIYSWKPVKDRIKWYFAFFLLLETAMLGVFVSLDVFLFYLFFEIGLVPMYFLIGIWGGPRREYAAIKFFLYTLVGSLAMLLSILALYYYSGQLTGGQPTFSILKLAELQPAHLASGTAAALIFWGIFLGFAIKVPMWPFHTWLPDAHVEAPTAGSVILAGVMLKLGTYGFVRILMPVMPEQCTIYGSFIVILAVIAIVYGALVAMAQTDMKKLVAYSSVNHMGYVMLGLGAAMMYLKDIPGNPDLAQKATMAVNGAILQMICHGVITAGLFFLVGMIYDRTHTRMIGDYGGIMKLVPQYSGIFMVMAFASLGLPSLAGFIAEFHVFVGALGTGLLASQAQLIDGPMLIGWTCFGILGVLITAAYFLWLMQRVLLGPVKESLLGHCHDGKLTDLGWPELLTIAPLVLLSILIGIVPGPIVLDLVNQFTYHTLTTLHF